MYRVLQSVQSVQNITECYRVLQSVQSVTENIHEFNNPPTCFEVAWPSSGRMCRIQKRNCLGFALKTVGLTEFTYERA